LLKWQQPFLIYFISIFYCNFIAPNAGDLNFNSMSLKELLEFRIIETDKLTLTAYQVFVFVVIIVLTWLILRFVKYILNRRMNRLNIDMASAFSIFQIVKYIIWVLAIGIALETIGIKFNLLIASSAALLVGVGLGLQQVFMDYVAGIILLLEGGVKIKDVVQIDDLIGQVKHIGLRTSRVETRDSYIIIVPNNRLVNDMLINWSHNKKLTRFNVSVGVAYGSDTRLVEKSLLECAKEHEGIANHPAPFVRFNDFGDSSLAFQLFFYTENSFRVENIKSKLRFKIDDKFRENGIKIPFPQRDVHMIKSDL
jgi:small-conductance mechanosensitive channel